MWCFLFSPGSDVGPLSNVTGPTSDFFLDPLPATNRSTHAHVATLHGTTSNITVSEVGLKRYVENIFIKSILEMF